MPKPSDYVPSPDVPSTLIQLREYIDWILYNSPGSRGELVVAQKARKAISHLADQLGVSIGDQP